MQTREDIFALLSQALIELFELLTAVADEFVEFDCSCSAAK